VTREVRSLIRALATAVVEGREDATITRPVAFAMVRSAVMDFERYYDVRHAANRVRDFDILTARNKAAKQIERGIGSRVE
jgi:hypothetical protein